ncbi:Translation initiation factor IF-2 [Nymphon striatum]|nr:Translation initiation factor IF-2 [Nymphon striatum]
MSDIIVKQLAELIGAPVESLLQQLNDAGISVTGADDSITDAQKLKLLEFIRTGQATTEAAPKKAGGKISLKRRSSSEINVSGAQGKTNVSVELSSFLMKEKRAKKQWINLKQSVKLTSERKAEEKIERDTAKEAAEAEKAEVETVVETKATTESTDTPTEAAPEAETESAPAEVAEKPAEETPAPVEKLVLPTDPRERREFLAKRARDEACCEV